MRPYKIPGLRIVLDPRGVELRIHLVADFEDGHGLVQRHESGRHEPRKEDK
jgi:hypothetical protein